MGASHALSIEHKPLDANTSDQMILVVLFRRAWGSDPHTGHRVFRTSHRVAANLVHQEFRSTRFINSEGEIVASWPTSMIRRIEWPSQFEERVAFLRRKGEWDSRLARIRLTIPNAYKPWTVEQDHKLRDLFERGCPTDEIGKVLGRGTRGIECRLTTLGFATSA